MGQRNCTYIIVQFGVSSKKDNITKRILPIYNQWNFIEVQAPKMVRGLKAVLGQNWDKSLEYTPRIPLDKIYYTGAGLNVCKDRETKKKVSLWVGGYDETQLYLDGDYTGAFQEDNNNGWNIAKFIVDPYKKTITAEIYCVTGSEDKDRANSKTLESYFLGGDKKPSKKDIEYLKQFNWNPKLRTEAKKLIADLVKEGEEKRAKLIQDHDNEQAYKQ